MGVTKPLFQVVDGIKLPLGFDPDRLRSCLRYESSEGDIFIDTFPKCGTNWTKRIVQLLVGKNSTQGSDYFLSTCFFEMVGKDVVASLPHPRIIVSHLEYQLLPQNPRAKYIYVVRNPKDCCVSYFHHTKKTQIYNFGNVAFDEYVQTFINGEASFGDYFSHLTSWYPNIHSKNVLSLTYEAMNRDHAGSVLKIAKFLHVDDPELLEPTSDKFRRVVYMSSLDSMKKYLNENYKKAVGDTPPERWTPRKDFPLGRAPPPPSAMDRKASLKTGGTTSAKRTRAKLRKPVCRSANMSWNTPSSGIRKIGWRMCENSCCVTEAVRDICFV